MLEQRWSEKSQRKGKPGRSQLNRWDIGETKFVFGPEHELFGNEFDVATSDGKEHSLEAREFCTGRQECEFLRTS